MKKHHSHTVDMANKAIELNAATGFNSSFFNANKFQPEKELPGCKLQSPNLKTMTPFECVEQYLPDDFINEVLELSNNHNISCTTDYDDRKDHIPAWYNTPPPNNDDNDDDSDDDYDTIIPCVNEEAEDEEDEPSTSNTTSQISSSDLYLYLSTFITIMYASLPSLTDYFSTRSMFGNKFIQSIWPGRDHFLMVHRRLRMNPYHFTRWFNTISSHIWNPFPNITIDESLMQFTGCYIQIQTTHQRKASQYRY